MKLVTLTTDFGMSDGFVGTMKGVILGIEPSARLVDVSHGIPRGDIRRGAFVVMAAVPYFPVGAIHVVVVDPGVGSERLPVAVRTPAAILIGPDNGVLSWALRAEKKPEIRVIENPRFRLPRVSQTFHGRDVFAPAAAVLAAGQPFDEIGPSAMDFHRIPWPEPTPIPSGWQGEALYIDTYGNVITSLPSDLANLSSRLLLSNGMRLAIGLCYAAVPPGHPVVVGGSTGFLEIAINQGDAAKRFALVPGSEVILESSS